MKTILVAGGAGYIGSFTVHSLLEAGYQPVVLDNLSTGKREAVPPGVPLHEGDIADHQLLDAVFRRYQIGAVMHFAAKIKVGESVERPDLYYTNNLAKSLTLLDAMRAHGCSRFIFSSTAAVYGEPQYLPVDEKHPVNPINPYGRSKLMLETVLRDYSAAFPFKAIVLRYFNAAGADPAGRGGESQEVKQNLIPIVLNNLEKGITTDVFGGDWETPDGTPIRDYVHVADIAAGHLLALKAIMADTAKPFDVFNLGAGVGSSVKDAFAILAEVAGKPVPHRIVGRRAGDPGSLVASNEKAAMELGWKPKYSDLKTIISTACQWHFNRKF
ncbi:MAG: UDP-glucose 4-epimerase GalE [Nitrospinae bacterium]|nr:UDP-glucose 4-epimerase GalE [Nitrospinota bacterium]